MEVNASYRLSQYQYENRPSWAKGFDAYIDDKRRNENPYTRGSLDWQAWDQGWVTGKLSLF